MLHTAQTERENDKSLAETVISYTCFWAILGLYLIPAMTLRLIKASIRLVDDLSRKWLYT